MNINNTNAQHGVSQTQQGQTAKTNTNGQLMKEFQAQLKNLNLPRTQKQAMLSLFKENLKAIQGENKPAQATKPAQQATTQPGTGTAVNAGTNTSSVVAGQGNLPVIMDGPAIRPLPQPVVQDGAIAPQPLPQPVIMDGPTLQPLPQPVIMDGPALQPLPQPVVQDGAIAPQPLPQPVVMDGPALQPLPQPVVQDGAIAPQPLPQPVIMDGLLPDIAVIPPVLQDGVIPVEPPAIIMDGSTPYFL